MERVIFHIDVNSAYLSWEAVSRLEAGERQDLREIASAVGGDASQRRGVILAKSTAARRRGVKTGEPLWMARQKCPELVVVPSNFALYSKMSGRLMDLLGEYSPVLEQFSIDECFLDYTGMDRLFGPPKQAADRLRQRIRSQLHFTVNVGVGPNKLLAKMAGELEKPDRTHTLFQDEIAHKMWPLPVGELFMVGPSVEKALVQRGIATIGQLAACDPEYLLSFLKGNGLSLWEHANGMDHAPLVPNELTPPKSYSQSTTTPEDVRDWEHASAVMLKLCDALCARMRRDGYACASVTVSIRRSDNLQIRSHQCQLDTPSSITGELYQRALTLLRECWHGEALRALGLGFTGLVEEGNAQISLFDDPRRDKLSALDQVTDGIRSRFGSGAIQRAGQMNAPRMSHLDRYASGEMSGKTKCPL